MFSCLSNGRSGDKISCLVHDVSHKCLGLLKVLGPLDAVADTKGRLIVSILVVELGSVESIVLIVGVKVTELFVNARGLSVVPFHVMAVAQKRAYASFRAKLEFMGKYCDRLVVLLLVDQRVDCFSLLALWYP